MFTHISESLAQEPKELQETDWTHTSENTYMYWWDIKEYTVNNNVIPFTSPVIGYKFFEFEPLLPLMMQQCKVLDIFI